MPASTEALKRAKAKYDKANTCRIALKLNIKTDRDILDYLDRSNNKQGTIKAALREYMKTVQ